MRSRSDRQATRIPALVALVAGIAFALAGCGGGGGDSGTGTNRRAQVEARGAQVMPFDQSRTTHIFRTTPTGGLQTVVVKNPHDVKQIALIRGHLRNEAKRFAAGDFSDPMAIHGMKMPGLDALRRNASRVRVEYSSTPLGARIAYTASDPELVGALHDWFEAQLMDHGADAHE